MPYPANKEFVEAYQKEFDPPLAGVSAASYAGCQLWREAVRRAGTLDTDRVRD